MSLPKTIISQFIYISFSFSFRFIALAGRKAMVYNRNTETKNLQYLRERLKNHGNGKEKRKTAE